MTHSNGDIYEGELANGLRHGYGTYIYANKTVYKGHWQNNHKTDGIFEVN